MPESRRPRPHPEPPPTAAVTQEIPAITSPNHALLIGRLAALMQLPQDVMVPVSDLRIDTDDAGNYLPSFVCVISGAFYRVSIEQLVDISELPPWAVTA